MSWFEGDLHGRPHQSKKWKGWLWAAFVIAPGRAEGVEGGSLENGGSLVANAQKGRLPQLAFWTDQLHHQAFPDKWVILKWAQVPEQAPLVVRKVALPDPAVVVAFQFVTWPQSGCSKLKL